MLPVATNLAADTTLSVYAGQVDDQKISVLAINKTDSIITSDIQIDGISSAQGTVQVDVIQASNLDGENVAINGLVGPANDFSNAQSAIELEFNNPLNYSFEPYSITLLQIELNE